MSGRLLRSGLGVCFFLATIGLITTHDLALTDLVGDLNGRTRNIHFDERYEGGSPDASSLASP